MSDRSESGRERELPRALEAKADDGHMSEQSRLLVEAVRDYAIFMLDTEGYITSWNTGAERLNYYTREEVVGRHVSMFYTPQDCATHHADEELRRAHESGRYEEEGWRVRKDGTHFWANVILTPVFDDDGRHIGFGKVIRDVSEQRLAQEKLRESEGRFRLLVESVKDYAIFMIDPKGLITTWNRGAEHIHGYLSREAIGQHFSMFYQPAQIADRAPENELEVATRDGRFEELGWRRRKNGDPFWAHVVLTAIYDDAHELKGFAKVTRDLTEQMRIQKEAHVAEEQVALEKARTLEADLAVKVRDDFIAMAAHDLRTPLTGLRLRIQGIEQLLHKLASDSGATFPAKLWDRVRGAKQQLEWFSQLIDRLLDFSRIVGGHLEIIAEPTDLSALVRQVVSDFHEPAEEDGVSIELSVPDALEGVCDATRMQQVVGNLLSNALKYGAGKPISVALEQTETEVILKVRDHGIGVKPEDFQLIFARFERGVSAHEYVGLGLGLYITKHIIGAHGGTIELSSEVGSGSTFTVRLPRSTVA